MAYDEALADRIRPLVAAEAGLAEKKMFGGLSFLVGGNMAVGVIGPDLVVRIDPAAYDDLLAEPGARVFDFSGRPMAGWLTVGGEAVAAAGPLATWVGRGTAYARSLPPKG